MSRLSSIFAICLSLNCVFLTQSPGIAQVKWEADKEFAIKEAAQKEKYVLYHFTADWCRPCRNLEKFVFPNPAVSRAFEQHVIPVQIDVDLNPDLVQKYGITGIPADVIITPSGRAVIQRPSPSDSDGYISMLKQLDRVDRETANGNLAFQEKIHELGLPKPSESRLAKRGGDFEPNAPSHQQAPYSKESAELNDKYVGKAFDRTSGKLVSAEENTMVYIDATQPNANAPNTTPPDVQTRIVNGSGDIQSSAASLDRAFAEKTKNENVVQNRFFAADAQIKKNDFADQASAKPAAEKPRAQSNPTIPDANIEQPVAFKPDAAAKNQKLERADDSRVFPTKVENIESNRIKTTVQNRHFESPQPAAEFALHGKCPVTLIQDGRWVDGDKKFGCAHRGKVYLFTDPIKLKLFQRHPDDFSPMLAGFDPVTFMERGELVGGQEKYGVFMGKSPNVRVVLFSNLENRKKFEADPRRFMSGIRQAESNAGSTKIR